MSQWVGFVSGAGIAAALPAVSRLLAEPSTRRVWVFCDRVEASDGGAGSDGLEQLLLLKDRNMERLSLGVVMEREPEEAALLSGRLDGAKVRLLAGRLFEAASVDGYFICGPENFADDVKAVLSSSGVSSERVHVERAGGDALPRRESGSPQSPGGSEQHSERDSQRGSEPDSQRNLEASEGGSAEAARVNPAGNGRETQVSFVMDGRRRSFTMKRDEESILDAADRAGIELPFSCKAGVCATCRTKLVKGKVDLVENNALEDWELEQGFILACQARARTPEIELTYDEK